MGRFLLLVIAAAVIGSIALTAGRPDLDAAGQDRESAGAALARNAADAASAAVAGDMVDPATRRFRTALTLPTDLRFDGDRAHIDGYRLEDGGRTAVVTVTGFAAGVAHQVTSRYRLGLSDFPGPLWIDAPLATATVSGATISGTGPDGTTRPVYFDASRFADYRLGSTVPLATVTGALGAQIGRARSSLSVQSPMDAVRTAAGGTPTIAELDGAAVTAFGSTDFLLSGATTITGTRSYGHFGDADDPDPRIVRVTGPLTIPAGATLTGNGMLIVQGDLSVAGTLRWDGLVLVTTPAQRVSVDLPGTVEIRGSFLVDQEAPPPGGHTDLTVNRDMTGRWATPGGESGAGRGGYWWGLRHTHRIESTIPNRTFYFAEPGASRHEGYTRFEQTLAAAGGPVYLRFKNPENHGASRVRIRLGGTDYTASVSAGFPAGLARTGDPHATRTFSPNQLDSLVVEIRSLRMLAHLTNRDASGIAPTSPNWMPGGLCSDRPACVGQVQDRDGALALEIVRASDDRVIYDASMYWHTQDPGGSEHRAEEAAEAAWRASIAAGTGYGTRLALGSGTTLAFSIPRMTPIAARLGLTGGAVTHLGSTSRHWTIGESAASSATGDGAAVTVCAAGSTQSLAAASARAAMRRGATLGAC